LVCGPPPPPPPPPRPYSYASRIKFMREFGINSRVLFR
jgi:hypothetical protein